MISFFVIVMIQVIRKGITHKFNLFEFLYDLHNDFIYLFFNTYIQLKYHIKPIIIYCDFIF